MQNIFHESTEDTERTADVQHYEARFYDNSLSDGLRRAAFPSEAHAIRTVEQLRMFVSQNIDGLFDRALAVCYQSTERAEEVVQELYPRLLRFLESHPEGLREPWAAVHRVARHLAVDGFRRTRRQQHESLPDDDVLAGMSQDQNTAVEDEERNALIEVAVKTLAPRSANIINGLFFDGRSGKDLAEELSLSESRMSELKSDALTHLRRSLSETSIAMPDIQEFATQPLA